MPTTTPSLLFAAFLFPIDQKTWEKEKEAKETKKNNKEILTQNFWASDVNIKSHQMKKSEIFFLLSVKHHHIFFFFFSLQQSARKRGPDRTTLRKRRGHYNDHRNSWSATAPKRRRCRHRGDNRQLKIKKNADDKINPLPKLFAKQQETQTSETAKDGRRTEKARASSDR